MLVQILVVDSQPERAGWIQSYFQKNSTTLQSAESLHDAVRAVGSNSCFYIVLAHCDFLNESFTSMARLRQNPRVKILFYSSDPREKLRSAPLIPDEMDALVAKVLMICSEQSARGNPPLTPPVGPGPTEGL